MGKSINKLLHKFFSGSEKLKKTEYSLLFHFFNSEKGKKEFNLKFDKDWEQYISPEIDEINSEKMWNKIHTQIKKSGTGIKRKVQFIRYSKYAAAAVILFALTFTFTRNFTIKPIIEESVAVIHSYSCSPGEVNTVELPDGSVVNLFPGSKLFVAEDFGKGNIREASLTGEAFFDIYKNPQKPFILKTGDVGLKVLGTSFNVSNLPSSKTVEVILHTGKVSLFEAGQPTSGSVLLEVNQKATYNKGQKGFVVENVDSELYRTWVDGTLKFIDEPMPNVFHKLGKWYDVDFDVIDQSISSQIYTATIQTEPLESILELLEFTASIETTVEQSVDGRKKVIITKQK